MLTDLTFRENSGRAGYAHQMKFVFGSALPALMLSVLVMGTTCLTAQIPLSGVVVDPDGAAVPGVDVRLQNLRGQVVLGGAAVSDAEGRFHLRDVAPGDDELKVPAKYGFELYEAPLHIGAGATTNRNALGDRSTRSGRRCDGRRER
jgi:hypothetical protein